MTALAKKGGAIYNQNDFSCRSELPVAVENRKNEEPALLSTKLKMPRPRRDYVVRRSLFEKLKRCSEMSVVFVKGAAGMGKTTLLSSFIMETGLKSTAWLSLDETNNSVFSFWHYFAAAVGSVLGEKVDFGMSRPLFELRDLKNDLVFLINRLCGETDYFIVLDDFHCVTDPALIDTLEFFLKAMPENLHLFLLSREDPPVYLGALAVSGKLLYVSGEEMKFSHEESIQFLKSTMRLKADDDKLEKISGFAEGWVGGLQLAAAGGEFSGDLLKQGGGFAAEYLTREVFGKLLPEEQKFLVWTGVLSWFSGDICSSLFENLDFNSMLEDLLDKNLFVICIDEEKGVYRYHNILSEYLKQRFAELPEQEQRRILRKAAPGFEKEGDCGEAARLLIEAKEYGGAAENILQMAMDTEAGEYINRLPMDFVVKNIDLTVRGIIYNVDLGNMTRFEKLCGAAVVSWQNTPFCGMLTYAHDVLCKNSVVSPPAPLALSAFEGYGMRRETAAFILLGVANLMVMDRRYPMAVQYADRAQEMGSDAVSLHYYVYALKAQLDEETGNLNGALENYRKIQSLQKNGGSLFMEEYDYRIGIAGVYLKRMELPQAKEVLQSAETMLTHADIPDSMVRYSLSYNWAEYEMLLGEEEKAVGIIGQIVENSNAVRWADRLLVEMEAAGRMQPELEDKILTEYESCQEGRATVSPAFELLCARLYFRRGEAETAAKIINGALAFSRENQNRLRLVEADLLLIRMTGGSTPADRRRRNNLLREAVYYSWENRILQPYYVDRHIMEPLWKDFNAALSDKLSEEERRFVRDAMRICSQTGQPVEKDILSAREREVLAELAQGKTNPQIAEDLCISLSTVKTHVLSIYGKLDVSSRVSAVEEGKRLGLIS